MNELALFSGAGGGLLASSLLGFTPVCAVERDEYCQHVLVQRQNDRVLPSFPIWDDIRTFKGGEWRGVVDLVSGGFPCQAFSKAARGRNKPEKDLWGEMLRVVSEVEPTFCFAENVSEASIQKARDDLSLLGYTGEYLKLSAKDLGADHIRTRYWLLAYSNHYGELRSSKYAKAQVLPQLCKGVWEAFPDQLRVDDGVAFRMDRLKASGNGQVPIVAAVAFIQLVKRLGLM